MLYLIATPIGNLSDITLRALEAMRQCDYLLCEDTRRSKILLSHYEISLPLRSFHAHNERKKTDEVLLDLKEGKRIGLLSDAGHPCINDPGTFLVSRCREEGLPIEMLPGPSSIATALSLSGLFFTRFQFIGYLPKKLTQSEIHSLQSYPGLTLCFETPHQLIKTLTKIDQHAPEMQIVVMRELTKKFEEVAQGFAKELLAKFTEPKGEFVLIFQGSEEKVESFEKAQIAELVSHIESKYGLSRKMTAELLHELKGISKKEVYQC